MSDTAGFRREAGCRDSGAIDRLLLEAGLDDDGGLRPVLRELQLLAAVPPVASAAVAALMVPGASGTAPAEAASGTAPAEAAPAAPPADELAARRRARRRVTLTTLSLAVSLTAGGAVAAASDQGIRDSFGQLNHAITSLVAGPGGASPDGSGHAPASGSTQPGGTGPVPTPADPAPSGPATPPATGPAPGAANGREDVPAPASPAAVPPSGATLPGNLTPGVPGDPLNGGHLDDGMPDDGVPGLPGQQTLLPLPVTPPVSPAPAQ